MLAVEAARRLQGEIINADSRQIYRGLAIGTGLPSPSLRAHVPHHLFAFVDPAERFSAARYAEAASGVLEEVWRRGHLPIVVGGTGFYIEALTGSMRLDRPPGSDQVRRRLRRELAVHEPAVLWEWLHALAPTRASAVRPSDTYRIARSLEVVLTGRRDGGSRANPMAGRDANSGQEAVRPAHAAFLIVRLLVARDELHRRIDERVRRMFAEGLIEEALAVRERCPEAPALSGIGYAEALAVADGLATVDEGRAAVARRTKRYAKRQDTWFAHMENAVGLEVIRDQDALERLVGLARERLCAA